MSEAIEPSEFIVAALRYTDDASCDELVDVGKKLREIDSQWVINLPGGDESLSTSEKQSTSEADNASRIFRSGMLNAMKTLSNESSYYLCMKDETIGRVVGSDEYRRWSDTLFEGEPNKVAGLLPNVRNAVAAVVQNRKKNPALKS